MVKATENHLKITLKEVRKVAPNKNNDKQLQYYFTVQRKKATYQTNGETYASKI